MYLLAWSFSITENFQFKEDIGITIQMNSSLYLLKKVAASRIPLAPSNTKEQVEHSLKYPKTPSMNTGELLEHQIDHAQRLLNIFKRSTFAGDTSTPGKGKTYSASYVAKHLNLPVMVFCPKSAIEMWYDVLTSFGVSIVGITNYDMARSSHSETDVKTRDMRDGFTTTATLCHWIRKKKTKRVKKGPVKTDAVLYKYRWHLPYKCFIIFDEEHIGKNVHTLTFQLISGAIEAATKQGHKVLLLSATPIEKDTNLKSIMYFLGLIKAPTMNSVSQYFGESVSKTDMKMVHERLYDPEHGYMSFMPDANIPAHITNDVKPMTFEMSEDITEKIVSHNQAIMDARRRLKERKFTRGLGDINTNRTSIEMFKVQEMAKIVAEVFKTGYIGGAGPFKRIGIFVNHKNALRELSAMLGALIGKHMISEFHGDQTSEQSSASVSAFMSGKTSILIATIKKGGQSISFHDTIGDKPTLVLISPPTSGSALLQCVGRFFRTNVKSSVTQCIVFTKGDPIEESIRDGLARKMNDITRFAHGTDLYFDLYDLVDDAGK